MKIMHVDSSPKGNRSNSRALSRYFMDALIAEGAPIEADYLDVSANPPSHVTGAFAVATYTPEAERTPEMKATLIESDILCQRLLDADALVFAMPMYNFSVPSTFKAFIDNIVRTDLTYIKDEDGQYHGTLAGKPVLFITSRGADLRPGNPLEHFDALTPVLRAAFGFLGVNDPTFVNAQPLQFADPEARAAALERAQTELTQVAQTWARTNAKLAAV